MKGRDHDANVQFYCEVKRAQVMQSYLTQSQKNGLLLIRIHTEN